MKKTTFAKTVLACAIPAALALSVQAAPLKGHDIAAPVQEQRLEVRPTSLIVKFKSDVNTLNSVSAANTVQNITQQMATTLGQNVNYIRPMAVEKFHVIDLSEKLTSEDVAAAIANLEKNANIELVEENIMHKALMTPNDSRYSDMWHLPNTTGGLRVEGAWDKATGSGVTVAVLDTGIRSHSDLNANIVGGYDMISSSTIGNDGNGRDSDPSDPGDWVTANECGYTHSASDSSWHGTHVAGTVAAVGNNNKGVIGVAYGSKVVPVRVLGKCGGTTADIADGIIWAAGGSVSGVPSNSNPADVINMSLGGGSSCQSVTQSAINTARSLGATVVVAAGNSSANASGFTPASCSGVVTVAATDKTGGDSYYTNYGSVIDVAAPGGAQSFANDSNGILSTLNSGSSTPGSENYEYFQGTSMAAPHVAGVAALMYEENPSITPDQVESILKSTSRSFPASCNQCGSGIVDATAAVNAVNGGGSGSVDPVSQSWNNQSASRNQWVRKTFSVASGASSASFAISGGTGDADLYVRSGSQPSTNSYDCRPYKYGNSETCDITSPNSGTWHIGVRAYSAFTGVKITASYQ